MYRIRQGLIEFLLVHPGGPFWRNKDAGAWTIPKGEIAPGEEPLKTAQREFEEELGAAATGPFVSLTPIRQKGGKVVCAWACQGTFETSNLRSNTFKIEWPPRSGNFAEFPEVDRAEFFPLEQARSKINPAQGALLEECSRLLSQHARGIGGEQGDRKTHT